jgi:hypothetical protein
VALAARVGKGAVLVSDEIEQEAKFREDLDEARSREPPVVDDQQPRLRRIGDPGRFPG